MVLSGGEKGHIVGVHPGEPAVVGPAEFRAGHALQGGKVILHGRFPPVRTGARPPSGRPPPETKTFGYYYTLEGDLDNDSIITNEIADSFREQLKKELINSVELKAYKEKELNFAYIYLSQSTGKVRFKTVFTPQDYNTGK